MRYRRDIVSKVSRSRAPKEADPAASAAGMPGRTTQVPPGESGRALGAALRRARQGGGILLADMARRSSYSKGHLSAVENGLAWPSRELLDAYERVLEMAPQELSRLAESIVPGRRRVGTDPTNASGVAELLTQLRNGISPEVDGTSFDGSDRLVSRTRIGTDQLVIRGFDACLQRAAELVEAAAKQEPGRGDEVVFSLGGLGRAPGMAHQDAVLHWQRALRMAMARGWDVVNLARLHARSEARPIALVTEMLELLGYAGRYQPYSLPSTQGGVVPDGFVIVPGQGALHFLATQQESALDAATLYTDADQVAFLRDHAHVLLAQATPILKLYRGDSPSPTSGRPQPDSIRYDFARTRAATRPGDRFLVKNGLSILRIPNSIFAGWVRRLSSVADDNWADWIPTLVENRLQRVAAFNEQVRRWRFIDLCSKPAIERMVSTGTYGLDQPVHGEVPQRQGIFRLIDASDVPATPDERAAILRSVVDLLRTYPNYELGLLDDPAAQEAAETYWEVKGIEGDAVLLLDTWCLTGAGSVEINLEIGKVEVVEAFRGYFLSIWEGLVPEHREKERVIAWLVAQIDRIPQAP